jgi:hypothetical protein
MSPAFGPNLPRCQPMSTSAEKTRPCHSINVLFVQAKRLLSMKVCAN